jgi:hypothetical protein
VVRRAGGDRGRINNINTERHDTDWNVYGSTLSTFLIILKRNQSKLFYLKNS